MYIDPDRVQGVRRFLAEFVDRSIGPDDQAAVVSLSKGGTFQNFGNLTLDGVTVQGSHAVFGGAIMQEPCTGCLTPLLTIRNSLFRNNNAKSEVVLASARCRHEAAGTAWRGQRVRIAFTDVGEAEKRSKRIVRIGG